MTPNFMCRKYNNFCSPKYIVNWPDTALRAIFGNLPVVIWIPVIEVKEVLNFLRSIGTVSCYTASLELLGKVKLKLSL